MNRPQIHPEVSIGHVHLKVADLERSLGFYRDVLGFEVTQRYGPGAAFLSAGGYHHHLGLNTWGSLAGPPPPAGTTGLFHLAILYPTRAALAAALRHLMDAGIALDGASDHGVSEAPTSATPTRTASNCTGTAPRQTGRECPTGRWRCTPGHSTSKPCWPRPRHPPEEFRGQYTYLRVLPLAKSESLSGDKYTVP